MPVSVIALPYGKHPDQRVYQYQSPQSVDMSGKPIMVLVHGGYWRESLTYQLMTPLAEKFVAAGWNVFSLEYRRGANTSWEDLLQDTHDGFALIQTQRSGSEKIVSVGHSVGGQIVLLNADAADAVVALSPVTDVARAHDHHLGDDAVAEFFGRDALADRGLLEDASPLHHLNLLETTPVMVVQGNNDTRVLASHVQDYLNAAKEAGANVDAIFLSDCLHIEQINPDATHWPMLHAWLAPILEPSDPTPREAEEKGV